MHSGPSKRDKYSIIIPAAGLGKRMKMQGPKAMLKINDKETILSRQIKLINACFKHCEIIVVGGFQYEKLHSKVKNVRFVNNKNYETTNVAGSIALGLKKIKTDKVLVVYGDLIFNKEALNLTYKESVVVLSNIMKSEEVGCITNEHVLESMFYKLPTKWSQITYLTGIELKLLRILVNEKDCFQWFGFEVINEIINRGGIFKTVEPKNSKVIDIDCSADLKLMEKHEIFNTQRKQLS